MMFVQNIQKLGREAKFAYIHSGKPEKELELFASWSFHGPCEMYSQILSKEMANLKGYGNIQSSNQKNQLIHVVQSS